jgi:arginyl-tRNA synthetase
VQEIYKKIENKDPEVLKQFKEKKKWSEDDFNKIYEELNVNFDRIYYDSDYIAKGKGVVSELAKKGIAVKDEGAMLVDLEKYNLQKVLVLRSDQTALYITKDVAMAMERINEFNLDRLVYVVGAEQQLHFRQLFKILELHGFEQAKKCFHLSYELVRLQDARMSSRKGSIILYSTLRDAVVKHAREEVEKRHPDWSEEKIENSAGNIALAAIKFTMLHQDNNKVIKFDIQKALDFEGETGPYIQYTHARINSILRKYNDDIPNIIPVLKETHEFALIKLLHKFNMVIKHAAESYKPPLLTYYLLELSRAFNEFYHACPVLKSEESVRNNRIVLINAVKEILQKGLTLLGIPAPQEM